MLTSVWSPSRVPTESQENVFAITVCIQLRMPLIIIGPPGSSKTLSFQIVQQSVLTDAMVRDESVVSEFDGNFCPCHSHGIVQGKSESSSSIRNFFGGFMSIEASVFHYQCSEHSTSK